jgi:hypothetical protein
MGFLHPNFFLKPMVLKLSHYFLIAGDFAVLLKAGMTVKQAIVYNLLSAMMAYIGMLIGTAVGQYANNITLWIFAITAGMFLYVALVDMVRYLMFVCYPKPAKVVCSFQTWKKSLAWFEAKLFFFLLI